mmetsp:Transcript_3682/g.23095  ORF Transcript_3682/g.23095 Transcript_3682/m.23095 type:complete len:268 (-) Transcript_3682:442-1245(-)
MDAFPGRVATADRPIFRDATDGRVSHLQRRLLTPCGSRTRPAARGCDPARHDVRRTPSVGNEVERTWRCRGDGSAKEFLAWNAHGSWMGSSCASCSWEEVGAQKHVLQRRMAKRMVARRCVQRGGGQPASAATAWTSRCVGSGACRTSLLVLDELVDEERPRTRRIVAAQIVAELHEFQKLQPRVARHGFIVVGLQERAPIFQQRPTTVCKQKTPHLNRHVQHHGFLPFLSGKQERVGVDLSKRARIFQFGAHLRNPVLDLLDRIQS